LNEAASGSARRCSLARGAWEHALRYSQERSQFWQDHSSIKDPFQLGPDATEIEAARMMVYNAARMKDAGMNFVKEQPMTKLFASQVAERVASLAVEIFGGYGLARLSVGKVFS